ncbi:hypothetical protein [Streptomyces cinereoruber]|uniref:hypothetical protein n=1 Tax=Streptomyces cinereoruber TaxID=67260 RepID=UPI0036291D4A
MTGQYWTGESVRIDAVLRPRDPQPWHDKHPAFGVEFKYQGRETSFYSGYDWVAQASTYTHSEWNGYGRLGIFLCPSPLSSLLANPWQVASQRQLRIAPEIYDGLRRWIAARDAKNGVQRPERYVSREALERHRSLIADMTYEEFTARADGYDSAEAREQEHQLRVALEVERLIGKLGVGELMPYEVTGWTLIRSGVRIWSEKEGVTKVPSSLLPPLGHGRLKKA